MSATGSVVTMGETMALLDAPASGRLGAGSALPLGIGGAESNVAIGLARLDVDCAWISRLGDDALGSFVIREIRAEGVRVLVRRDPDAPTGLMLKEHHDGRPWRVRYYRSGSAASQLSRADVDAAAGAIVEASVLHLTGITAALGPGPLAAMEHATQIARDAGTLVSFDVNHRATLWPDHLAAPVLARLCASADLVFAGPEEAALVLGGDEPAAAATFDEGEALARALAKRGPRTVVVKLGALGAVAVSGDQVDRAPAHAITVVDPVGAGDAFVAGYLSEVVVGGTLSQCLRMGNALGAAVCEVRGDWEGLPTRDELRRRTSASDVLR
ncbi:MAG: sugar kinase [Pseudonocardiales bacterium]|nr:sugar kinase [Pseudonocardiales bacterium]